MDIKGIKKIVDWYISTGCKTQNIDILLYSQDKLSAQLLYLAEEVGKTYKEYVEAEHNRKLKAAKSELQYEGTRSNAKASAVVDVEQELLNEVRLEANYKYFKGYGDAADKVLDAMRQRISYLKEEKKLTNFVNGKA